MFEAWIRGKNNNPEDVLTSHVFGTLKYFEPEDILGPFLRKAFNPYTNKSLDLPTITKFGKFKNETTPLFWKFIQQPGCGGCEPDVLIDFVHENQTRSLILIEVKYESLKSSQADEKSPMANDQLAKYWENLALLGQELDAKPILIYLTAHYSCPDEEIEESQKELLLKGKQRGDFFWLSWRHLSNLFAEIEAPLLKDLQALIEQFYQFQYFECDWTSASLPCTWKFNNLSWSWVHQKSSYPKIKWGFSNDRER